MGWEGDREKDMLEEVEEKCSGLWIGHRENKK
jgi:hypothetical protein